MRSRYTAFVLGDVDHLSRSWHPSTRPKRIHLGDDGGRRWRGLEVLATADGGLLDQEGTVEFRARYRDAEGTDGALHEVSRFVRHDGAWTYVDGTHH
ncbi:MAG: preprotein translocase [Acidimicrobiales bacterium]|nr:preprotein translocase [Acidimicrobiales bacterium]